MVPGSIPAAAQTALDAWLRHHDEHAPGVIEGLYVVGSIALDDWQLDSDVDVVAVSSAPAAGATVDALRAAHGAAMAEADTPPIDGPYVTWDDLRQPPTPATRPWTLHGEFHHDDGCFEVNPVTWLTLAEYGLALRGPAPSELGVAIDRTRVRSFIADNTSSYWASIGPSIQSAMEDPDRTEFDAALSEWCVLGAARMLYTARTGDVTSKSGAGRWIHEEIPRHRALVSHALAVRGRPDAPPDGREIAEATIEYLRDVCGMVDEATR